MSEVRAFEGRDPDARITEVLRAGREGAVAPHAWIGLEPSAVAMERRRRSNR